jgi:hypothetical protein
MPLDSFLSDVFAGEVNDPTLTSDNITAPWKEAIVDSLVVLFSKKSDSIVQKYVGFIMKEEVVGRSGHAVERRTVNRGDSGSIPPAAVLKLTLGRQFCSCHIYLCLSEKTLTAGGPFYLVSMLGEIIDPTQGVNAWTH